MTKKTAILAMVLSMMMTMASCGSEKDNTAKAETEKAPQTTAAQAENKAEAKSEETTAEAQSEEEEIQPEETGTAALDIPEEDFADFYGAKIYSPATDLTRSGYRGSKCSFDYNPDDGKYIELYDLVATYNTEDLPEMPVEDIIKDEDFLYYVCAEFEKEMIKVNTKYMTFTPQSEEKVQVLGRDFIKQKGTFRNEYLDEPEEFIYVAYIGMLDLPEWGKNCRVMWIDMSEYNDEETWKKLEERVDIAAQTISLPDSAPAETAEEPKAEETASGGIWFDRGVYATFENGEHVDYYVFESETEGAIQWLKEEDSDTDSFDNSLQFGGMGFTCEQTEDCIYFHIPFTQTDFTWQNLSRNSDGDVVLESEDGSTTVFKKLDLSVEDFDSGNYEFKNKKLDMSDI